MISELLTYSISDFIPFNLSGYRALFESMNRDVWPLHALYILGALGTIHATIHGRRWAGVLVAILCVTTAYHFFFGRYDQLNWAGGYFGAIFIAQALLLVFWVARFRSVVASRLGRISGLLFLGVGLGIPAIAALRGSLSGAEFIGLSPDPTAIFTLGFILLSRASWWFGLGAMIWCIQSALTLNALGDPQAWLLGAAPLIFVSVRVFLRFSRASS